MRDAARALDDVSDHLGEVLRHADELLAEWARFGGQVRVQVEREAAAIGAVVDGAVERAASSGIDRAIADRLRMLTSELERIEQRARAAARVVTEHREADRRVLWVVVAGIVLANALLVVLLLRKPEPARPPEPIRVESTAAPQPSADPGPGITPATGSGDVMNAGSAVEAVSPATGPNGAAASLEAEAGSTAGSGAPAVAKPGSSAPDAKPGSSAATAKPGSDAPAAAAKPGSSAPAAGRAAGSSSAAKPARPGVGSGRPMASPIVLPPKAGSARVHKKLP